MGTQPFEVPDALELLEFFEAEPVEQKGEDGYWCYEVADARGVKLRFSFNLFESSVQTSLSLGGSHIVTVSHERATRMRLRGGKLRCEFDGGGEQTVLLVAIGNEIDVSWSTLQTRP